MLVLTRKLGEKIVIGDVTIEIVRIECGKVRLGITAPENIVVVREELVGKPRKGKA